MARLLLMIGIPGSGKSTIANELVANGFVRLSADDIRAELYGSEDVQGHYQEVFGLLHSRLKLAIKDGKNIVIDNTNARKDYRDRLKESVQGHGGYSVEFVHVDERFDLCETRNNSRKRVVPLDVLLKMAKSIDADKPKLHEECDTLYTVRTNRVGGGIAVFVREKSGIREKANARSVGRYLANRSASVLRT